MFRSNTIQTTINHIRKKMQNKKLFFAVSNPPKCIANLRTLSMHFKMNIEIYQTSFVMKEVLLVLHIAVSEFKSIVIF